MFFRQVLTNEWHTRKTKRQIVLLSEYEMSP